MSERVVIETVEGYALKVGSYLFQMEEVRRRTLQYVAGLSAEQICWSPNVKCESIGTQLLHIAAVERSWIGEDIMRQPMEEWWAIAFPIRFDIPQISDKPLEYFIEILSKTRKETRRALLTLSDDDLSREVEPLDPGDEANAEKFYSIEWILYHVLEHEAHHKGQIAYLKRLLPEF